VPHINGPQDIKAHVGEINIAPFEGKQFATTKSRRHSQQPHQATNWNFGRNIDTSQEAHRAEFSPFSFAPSNLFPWNLYLGHDKMTMDKRRSP
jgi:hypothetical protein